MIEPLCAKCKQAVLDMPMGQGEFVSICYNCSLVAAVDYINQHRKTMETIKSKRVLHSKIKQILELTGDDTKAFPITVTFSEGMGEPVFTFTIERAAEDHFIDEKGQKWIRATS